MALVSESKESGRAGPGDDGDLVEGVLPPDPVGERAALQKFRVHLLEPLIANRAIHQELDKRGVRQKRAAVWVIGRQHHPPGVGAQQKQFEADRPLERGDGSLVLEGERHDAAAGLELDIDVGPSPSAALVQQILDGGIGGDRHRRSEHHLADVSAHLGVGVDVFDHLRGARFPPLPRLPAVAMELQMGEMRAPA